jgi:hypothetical protein
MVLDDDSLLDSIRRLFEAADPMPPDLPERIKFMVALRQLDAEVAWLVTAEAEAGLAARGTEESRTITFDSDSLTIMIRIDSGPGECIRVDGWLAPPQCRRVEMQMGDASIAVMADGAGRFVFHDVPRGTARVIVHAPENGPAGSADAAAAEAAKSVITPALVLLGGG